MTTVSTVPLGVKIRADPIPKIQNAGKIIATGGSTADHSIRPDIYPKINAGNPGTPERLKKYRKTTNILPGQIVVHPGLQESQPDLPSGYAFGRKTQFSEPVKDTIKAQNLVGLAAQFHEVKEKQYGSNVREPLGMGYSRGYNWPDKVQGQAFGVKCEIEPDQAKKCIYPAGGSLEERAEVKQMYQKTHGNWGPGE